MKSAERREAKNAAARESWKRNSSKILAKRALNREFLNAQKRAKRAAGEWSMV
jgi:hypothetical protein